MRAQFSLGTCLFGTLIAAVLIGLNCQFRGIEGDDLNWPGYGFPVTFYLKFQTGNMPCPTWIFESSGVFVDIIFAVITICFLSWLFQRLVYDRRRNSRTTVVPLKNSVNDKNCQG